MPPLPLVYWRRKFILAIPYPVQATSLSAPRRRRPNHLFAKDLNKKPRELLKHSLQPVFALAFRRFEMAMRDDDRQPYSLEQADEVLAEDARSNIEGADAINSGGIVRLLPGCTKLLDEEFDFG